MQAWREIRDGLDMLFRDRGEAQRWLTSWHPALGARPLDLMIAGGEGLERVRQLARGLYKSGLTVRSSTGLVLCIRRAGAGGPPARRAELSRMSSRAFRESRIVIPGVPAAGTSPLDLTKDRGGVPRPRARPALSAAARTLVSWPRPLDPAGRRSTSPRSQAFVSPVRVRCCNRRRPWPPPCPDRVIRPRYFG